MNKIQKFKIIFTTALIQVCFKADEIWALAGKPNPDPNAPQPPAWVGLMPFIVMFGIIYMLMIRPQMKARKEQDKMMNELKKGDKVVTKGGIIGTIVGTGPGVFDLKISDETKIKIQKDAVTGRYTEKVHQPEIVKK